MTRHTSFWDRRRAAVRAEADAENRAVQAQAYDQEQAVLAEKTDAELLADFDLPDPDGMKAGDDFAAFMVRAVPEHLRRRALRKLWTSDPVLACLDDLVDYADDYTQASAVTSFATSYEVGKGLRRHVEDVARKAAAALAQDDAAPETPVEMDLPETTQTEPIVAAAEPKPADTAPTTDATDVALPPRRMAFVFEEQTA